MIENDGSHRFESLAQTIYNTIFQSIDFHCYVIDRDYRIVWHNCIPPAGSRAGRYCYSFYQMRTTPCTKCPVHSVFVCGTPCILQRERFERLPDRKPRWAEIRAYPICDHHGVVEYVLTLGFDITEKKLEIDRHRKYADVLERRLSEWLKAESAKAAPVQRGPVGLTKRQLAVLKLVSEGFSNIEISRILSLSPHTVKSHIINIFNKLGVNDRTEAATAAARLRLV